jgi:elongation factor G
MKKDMGTTYEIVPIPEDMIAEVKNTDRFLLRQLLIMMNLLENSWKMNSITGRNQHCFKSAVMDMAIIPMIAGSSFKNKEFNSC